MPTELTSFVGRVDDLAEVRRLLAHARLLTLVGPGGVGKSRLGLRAAAEASPDIADGVRLAELSGLKSPDLLPTVVADALDVPVQDGQSPIDKVMAYVAERELLIVLDTCEHLVGACAPFAELLLSQALRLRILVTSRQALDVPGEYVLPVVPLGLSGGADSGDALELFEQRAAVAVPGLQFTDSEREIAAALCRRLDGIPLAIELTAVRLRALPLAQLAARLQESFALLDSGRKAVLGLVDKSVVYRTGDRYQLLDTIREFGIEMLGKSDETATVATRMTVYYQSRLGAFAEQFFTSEQATHHRALLPERENLRAVLEYAHADGALLPAAAAMWPYWLCSGQPAEASHWLGLAFTQQAATTRESAQALQWASTFAALQGDHTTATQLAGEMRQHAEQLGDPRLAALARLCAGQAAAFLGEREAAVADLTPTLAELRTTGTALDIAMATLRLGMAHPLGGQPGAAIPILEEVKRLAGEDSQESYLQGCAYGYMAVAQLAAGDVDAAQEAGRRSVALHDLRDGVSSLGVTLDVIAWTAVAQGRPHRAALILGAVDAQFHLLDRRRALGNPLLTTLHSQAVTTASEALGAEALDQWRRHGAGLSRERLVAFALSDDDTVPGLVVPPTPLSTDNLTQRERQIAALVAGGLTNREIATQLVISKRTVDVHVERILAKLGCTSRTQIASPTAGIEPAAADGVPDLGKG
ncbi:LuxR C-terminal-related transcriptional regulator [Streptomyces sp. NPDC051940]|uniref:ATP-binding protein n=1 Tax=Streptomyces sp. NPDC051940 TaxID=3155675 RepID=UPI003418AC40